MPSSRRGSPPKPLDQCSRPELVGRLAFATLFWGVFVAIGCYHALGPGAVGRPAFERWFGVRPDVYDELRRAVLG